MDRLSNELILDIFRLLTLDETYVLINNLSFLTTKAPVHQFILLAYERIYGGTISIYSNLKPHKRARYNWSVQFDQLKEIFTQSNSMIDDPLEKQIFMNTRPRYMKFIFCRETNDFTKFAEDLNDFTLAVEGDTKNDPFSRYLNSVLQCGISIDGSAIFSLLTSSSIVAVLRALIAISNRSFCEKVRELNITYAYLGKHFESQWGKLFSRFISVTKLDLTRNMIPLDGTNYINGEMPARDILGTCFEWPPNLVHLNLTGNLLTYVSIDFLQSLPKTLETLRLSENQFKEIVVGDLNGILPNLKYLELDSNLQLSFIDPKIFNSSEGKLKLLSISYCRLSHLNTGSLISVAKEKGFQIRNCGTAMDLDTIIRQP